MKTPSLIQLLDDFFEISNTVEKNKPGSAPHAVASRVLEKLEVEINKQLDALADSATGAEEHEY